MRESFFELYEQFKQSLQDPQKLAQSQLAMDQWLDEAMTDREQFCEFIGSLIVDDEKILQFILSFRMLTLRDFPDVLSEVARWDMQQELEYERFDKLLTFINQAFSQKINTFIKKTELQSIEQKLQSMNEMYQSFFIIDELSLNEKLCEVMDKQRSGLARTQIEAEPFHKWGHLQFEVLSYEWNHGQHTIERQLMFESVCMKYRAELESMGITVFPEKVEQWFNQFSSEKLEGANSEWLSGIKSYLFSDYILNDQLRDMSMKRIQWIGQKQVTEFRHDEQANEVAHRHQIISRLNNLYAGLNDPKQLVKANDLFSPKQDDVLRENIQQHIRGQVLARKIELTKHRPFIALAFYNHGKYEIKSMLHFVAEHKKNNREYASFINWLYGDQSLRADLDPFVQREMKSQIEWYIETDIMNSEDKKLIEYLQESEHDHIRKIALGE